MFNGSVPGGQAAGTQQTAMQALVAEALRGLATGQTAAPAPAPAPQAHAAAAPANDDRMSRADAEALATAAATAAVTAAMARVKTILTSEHAKGREGAAQALALDPSISSATAETLLAALPKADAPAAAAAATPATPANQLQAEMARRGNAARVQPDGTGAAASAESDLSAKSLALADRYFKKG